MRYDPTDIRSQEQVQSDKETRLKLAKEVEEADLKWLMSSKRGRRIVWRFLDRAGVFRPTFNTNAMQMSFAEGNRNAGLYILTQIHALCPELYPQMVKEQVNDNRREPTSRNDH